MYGPVHPSGGGGGAAGSAGSTSGVMSDKNGNRDVGEEGTSQCCGDVVVKGPKYGPFQPSGGGGGSAGSVESAIEFVSGRDAGGGATKYAPFQPSGGGPGANVRS